MSELVVNKYPKSGITEAIKSIKTNLVFSAVKTRIQTILITSSTSGEGKSFISANLASTFANSGNKTLIIDVDLRRGRQNRIFNTVTIRGLSNLLIDELWESNLEKYIQKSDIKNLDILTTGSYPPNPTVLLESKKFETVLNKFKEHYDTIILDAPPVIGLTDSLIISRLADIDLIVARSNKTNIEILDNTRKALESVGANIGGVIFNGVEYKGNKYYNKYYNNYYYTEK